MARYDKDEIKEKLTTSMVFDIVNEFGGEPSYSDFGFISTTICHNKPKEGSRKLYYYENTKLFKCYTGCDEYFDIFELLKKIHILRGHKEWSLYDSVRWIASRYGFGPKFEIEDKFNLPDWDVFEKYQKIANTKAEVKKIQLPAYDINILKNLQYPIIADWVDEGITKEILRKNLIGYYPSGEQITIPHFDIDGRFVGLRGRALGEDDAKRFGKYRPIVIGNTMYNHALGLNLYNINNSAEHIKTAKTAIIFEGEKSCLLYQSYYGRENDITVACCGSSVSQIQIQILLDLGVKEIVIGFDRQFKERNDEEFVHLVKNLKSINSKYNKYATISFLFDKENKLPYKASPIDCGSEIFLDMFKKRIIL